MQTRNNGEPFVKLVHEIRDNLVITHERFSLWNRIPSIVRESENVNIIKQSSNIY